MSEQLNHTQIIMSQQKVLAALEERSENQAKQISALFELLNRMDCKIDNIHSDLIKIKTERNLAVWIAGVIAGTLAGICTNIWGR